MTQPNRAALAVSLALLGLGSGCIYPTERSGELRIEFVDPVSQVFVGDSLQMTARVVDANGTVLPNVAVRFSSSDDGVALVSGAGRLLGIGPGQVNVVVAPRQLEATQPATLPVRVFEGMQIFALHPTVTTSPDSSSVRFGELLEVIGAGLDPGQMTLMQVGAAAIVVHSFVPADLSDINSLDTLRVYIPSPLPSEADLVLVAAGRGSAVRTLQILQEDVYEVVTGTVPDLGVVAGALLLPGLVLEAVPADVDPDTLPFQGRAMDFYAAHVNSGSGISVVLKTENGLPPVEQGMTFGVSDLQNDSGDWPWSARYPAHKDYGAAQLCGARWIALHSEARSDSIVVAMSDLPTMGIDPNGFMVSLSSAEALSQPLGYSLRFTTEYLATLPPDAGEENDVCDLAHPIPLTGETVSMNYDNEYDVDWYKFTINGPSPPTAAAKLAAAITESEPNDTLATANLVTLGDVLTGDISDPLLDVDFFKFFAEAGTVIDLDVDTPAPPPFSDGVLTLYDSTGSEIAFVDDDDFGLDPRLTTVIEATGWYFVSHQTFGRWSGFPGIEDAAPYTLTFGAVTDVNFVTIEVVASDEFDGEIVIFEAQTEKSDVHDFIPPVVGSCCAEPFEGGYRATLQGLMPPGDFIMIVNGGGYITDYTIEARLFQPGVTAPSSFELPAPVRHTIRSKRRLTALRALRQRPGSLIR
ncbi:MAG: hypothetical protein O7I93_15850 [Gemmatimonadetes bacterium]|nr:hypothetical protein [Gemmatimonadota bacterium]